MSDFKFSNETYFELDGSFKEGFTVVPNYILNNRNLSYKAVGLYVQILQYQNSPTHKIYMSSLQTYKTDKESSVRSGINELINEGFLTSETIRNEKGQMKGKRYIVHAKPIEKTTTEPKRENPVSDNPVSENHVDISKIGFKENKKKENIDVVVGEDKEIKLLEMYKTFKLEKRVMPHTIKLLKKYVNEFDLDVFETIFVNASEDSVQKKYAYIKTILEEYQKKNIKTLEDVKSNNKKFKENKNKKVSGKAFKKNSFHNCKNTVTEEYTEDTLEAVLEGSQIDKYGVKETFQDKIEKSLVDEVYYNNLTNIIKKEIRNYILNDTSIGFKPYWITEGK